MRTQGSPEELFHHRQRAMALLAQGLDKGEVARRIGVDRRTVRRWHHAFKEGGEAALAPKAGAGCPAKLNGPQKDELAQALVQGAKAAGFESELWTGRRIAALIHKRFGATYHERYVLRLVRSLRFTPQRPQPVAREKHPAAEARWVRWRWPALKKNRTPDGGLARFS